MSNHIGAGTAKLAGLQIDLLQKIRNGQTTIAHLEWLNRLTKKERDRLSVGAYTLTTIIRLNRSFDPKSLGDWWSMKWQDERSLALKEVDLSKIQLVENRDQFLYGHLGKRSEAYIPLDARVFKALDDNHSLIPEEWEKKAVDDKICITFDGSVLCEKLFKDIAGHHYTEEADRIFRLWYRKGGGWKGETTSPFLVHDYIVTFSAVLPAS